MCVSQNEGGGSRGEAALVISSTFDLPGSGKPKQSRHLPLLLFGDRFRLPYTISVCGIAGMDERKFEGEQSLDARDVYVSLTYDTLDATAAMARVKSPKAGAVVLFAGLLAHIAHSSPRLTTRGIG